MKTQLETKQLPQWRDPELRRWLSKRSERCRGSFEQAAGVLPEISGKGLRGLLLGAPADPELGTPSYERIAREYSAMRLHPLYHGLVLGRPESMAEVGKALMYQFGVLNNRKVPLDDLVALLYVMSSIERGWTLTTYQRNAVEYVIYRLSDSILRAIQALDNMDARLDPVRAVYRRVFRVPKPDELVVVVDAHTYSKYLGEGYTPDAILSQAAERELSTILVHKE